MWFSKWLLLHLASHCKKSNEFASWLANKMTNEIFLWLLPTLVLELWCLIHPHFIAALLYFQCEYHYHHCATEAEWNFSMISIFFVCFLALMGHWWFHDLLCMCFLPVFGKPQNCHHNAFKKAWWWFWGVLHICVFFKCHCHDNASLFFSCCPLFALFLLLLHFHS